jgi:hypothetical protein
MIRIPSFRPLHSHMPVPSRSHALRGERASLPLRGLDIIALVLTTLAILSAAAPLRAANTTNQRFEGSVVVFLGVPLPDPPHLDLPLNTDLTFEILDTKGWTHKVSPLGQVSGSVTLNITTPDRLNRIGKIVLVDRNGNKVYLTYTVSRTPTSNFYGTFTIVGGTGKFAGATGGGNLRHWQILYPSGFYVETYFDDGWISY